MAKCAICKKGFHSCSNCDHEQEWMYVFCCEECYHKSPSYKTQRDRVEKFVYSLTEEQETLLKDIILGDSYDTANEEIESLLWSSFREINGGHGEIGSTQQT